MKKICFKSISLIISLCLLVTICPFNIVIEASNDYNYFVINGGNGDGRTVSSPADSVETAIKAINADGLDENDKANIYIMQRSDYQTTPADKKHYITYWSYDGSLSVTHKAHITVRPYDVSVKTELASTATLGDVNKVIRLGGPTTFKGVRILAVRGYWNRDIYANGYDLTVEKDVSFGDLSASSAVATHCYGLHFSVAHWGGGTYNNPININYNAPTIADGSLYLTNYRGGKHTFNEDVNITINNPTLGSHATISFPIYFNGTALFKKNLNLYMKSADKIAFGSQANTAITVNGGIQIISNASVKYTNAITSLTCFSADTKIWDITLNHSAKDSLEFTSVAGKYKVTKDITVIAENQKGQKIYSDKNGFLTIPCGSWIISKRAVIHYGDANFDGVINIKDLVNLKKLIVSNNFYYESSDINDDKFINSADLILLKKHILDVEKIEWDKSGIELPTPLKLSGGADKEALSLKNSITNAPDTIRSTGTTYYISENGNDSNSGTSPDSPITHYKINDIPLKYGDAVLFKRGDTFRFSTHIRHKSGVSYGAYGSGEKPVLSGSLKNYAKNTVWYTLDGNIWETYVGTKEAAHIVFDEGKTIGYRKTSLDQVQSDGDYYHDLESGVLYLYLSQINPIYHFDSIEISTTEYIVFGGSSEILRYDITFENLSFKYISIHAMYMIGSRNFDIHGCEYYWIGGAYYGTTGKRYGNAIQFWSVAENCNASNNYFYEIFDAPISYQGLSTNRYTDMVFENNLMEYCSMNFEFWGQNSSTKTDTSSDPEAILKNTYFNNNILRFGGYGFGGIQRPEKSDQAFILTWYHKYNDSQVSNINICNNIFDTANSNFFYINNMLHQLNISSNTYYQQKGSEHKVVSNCTFYSEDQYSFEKAIELVDKNPKLIKWLD